MSRAAAGRDIEEMRDAARVVITERIRRWKADEMLQFQYSLSSYTAMRREDWLAWRRDRAVSNRLALTWGRGA